MEATTLSEGRGTTRPFHLVGAPWIDAEGLVSHLRALDLPGISLRPARFRPQFGKYGSEICAGVELGVTDRDSLEPVALGLHILKSIHDLHPGDFAWRSDPYEFVSDVPALDLLTGSAAARECIENGLDFDSLFESWRKSVKDFESRLDGVLLYHDSR